MRGGKTICCLTVRKGMTPSEAARRKEEMNRDGVLVITLVEGPDPAESGLRALLRNHRP